jgi:mannose-6-phosphate isomerase-like protein (cupin superfamily)
MEIKRREKEMPRNGYKTNIERKTLENNRFRKILYTTPQMQLVVMSLKKSEEIGLEKHVGITQFIRVEKGKAVAIVNGKRKYLNSGDIVIIPSNTYHNIIALANVKLYTIYSPPAH